MALNKLPDSTPPPVSVSSPIRLSIFFSPSLLSFNVLRYASVFSQNGSVRPRIHFLPPDPRPAVIGQRQGTLKDGQSVAEPGKLHVIIPTLSMKVFPGLLLVATA